MEEKWLLQVLMAITSLLWETFYLEADSFRASSVFCNSLIK
jgi:hypothetical protein